MAHDSIEIITIKTKRCCAFLLLFLFLLLVPFVIVADYKINFGVCICRFSCGVGFFFLQILLRSTLFNPTLSKTFILSCLIACSHLILCCRYRRHRRFVFFCLLLEKQNQRFRVVFFYFIIAFA